MHQPSKRFYISVLLLVACCIGTPCGIAAQEKSIFIPASTKYPKKAFYKKLWGEHYRKIWNTPVTINVVYLDTLYGGLVPYEAGGSRQTQSLKLKDRDGREYVLRSVDKTFAGALPEIAKGSFIEKIANDQVTISNPYGALLVAPLAEAAGILHTNPRLVYIPRQNALKEFNDAAGNTMYLLEQRPDGNWETAANFARSKKIIGTDKLLEKLEADNDNQVDQLLFLRSRLFDMFINDWGRHEDQWRWAAVENGKHSMYKPVPRDRDNAFTKFDGLLPSRFAPDHMQSFKNDLEDVNAFGYTARALDRRFTTALSLEDWQRTAADLQLRLTDSVIEMAVHALPPEVLPMLETEYVSKLKARRGYLAGWALHYYRFINKDGVDITGSAKRERVEITRVNEGETVVNVSAISKDGLPDALPFYHRTFKKAETKQVRIFGLGNDDEYIVNGTVSGGVPILIIGSDGKEVYRNMVTADSRKKTVRFYDDHNHVIETAQKNTIFNFGDSSRYRYRYKYFQYNKSGFKPILFYNQDDRIHAGLGYHITSNRWNKFPYAQKHVLAGRYSFDQKAFSITYKGSFAQVAGNWNLGIYANYDFVRWLNFFGLGNETVLSTTDRNFFRFRYKTATIEPSLEKIIRNRQRIKLSTAILYYEPLTDTGRFVFKHPVYNSGNNLVKKTFARIGAEYVCQHLDDSLLPTRGFGWMLTASYTQPINNSRKKGFANAGTTLHWYQPFSKTTGLVIRAGASALFGGTPEFYQYNMIGGAKTVRGYQRDRFQGEAVAWNQNELRWIKDIRSFLFNGKAGMFVLYDVGRAWQKGESSSTWHSGYGGGILISPFNKVTIAAAYAAGKEQRLLHLNIISVF